MSSQFHPQESIGAYVLNALDPEETAQVRAHLETCAECRATYDELAGLPAFLGTVAVDDTGPNLTGQRGPEPVLAEMRRRRRRRRFTQLAVAAAVLLVVGSGSVWAGRTWFAPPPSKVAIYVPKLIGDPVRWQARDPATQVDAKVTMNPVAWGTKVDIELQGVHKGEICALTVYDRQGRKWEAGSWKAAYADGVRWSGGVAVKPADVDRIVVLAHGYKRLVQVTG